MSQEKKDTPKERQRKEDILKGFEKLASELGGLNKEVKHGKTIPDSGIKVLDGIKKELEESLHSDYVVDVAQVHNFCTVVEKIKSSQKIYEDVLKEEGITPARKRSFWDNLERGALRGEKIAKKPWKNKTNLDLLEESIEKKEDYLAKIIRPQQKIPTERQKHTFFDALETGLRRKFQKIKKSDIPPGDKSEVSHWDKLERNHERHGGEKPTEKSVAMKGGKYSPEELKRWEDITSSDDKKSWGALMEDLHKQGHIAVFGGDANMPEKDVEENAKHKAVKILDKEKNIDDSGITGDAFNTLNSIVHRKEVSGDTISQAGYRKLKYKYKNIENGCIQFDFAYADNGGFAGKVIAYKPYFKYFGYSIHNFVGDRGKRFLEECTAIRKKHQEFSGDLETELPMIKEWIDSGKKIHSKTIPVPLKISPISGGFRRLMFMYSVDINGEKHWPNVKFPGDIPIKRALHIEDFQTTIDLMQKYNEKMFPPLIYLELPKGKYTLYDEQKKYDKYINFNPGMLFFFSPEGRRLIDLSVSRDQKDRFINREYIEKVASRTGLSFETLTERIVKEPFRFLAHCHINRYFLGSWRGTDSHYGNFFLSEKGEIFEVSDIGPTRYAGNIRIRIQDDIKDLLEDADSLEDVLEYLNIPGEEIEKYSHMALNAYLRTLEEENAKDLRSLFDDEESLLINEKDRNLLKKEKKENEREFKKGICSFLEKNLGSLNLNGGVKKKWYNHYVGEIKKTDEPWDLDKIEAEIQERFQNNKFSEEEFKQRIVRDEREAGRSGEGKEGGPKFKEPKELVKKMPWEIEEKKHFIKVFVPKFSIKFKEKKKEVGLGQKAEFVFVVEELSNKKQKVELKSKSADVRVETKLKRLGEEQEYGAVYCELREKEKAEFVLAAYCEEEIIAELLIGGKNEDGFTAYDTAWLKIGREKISYEGKKLLPEKEKPEITREELEKIEEGMEKEGELPPGITTEELEKIGVLKKKKLPEERKPGITSEELEKLEEGLEKEGVPKKKKPEEESGITPEELEKLEEGLEKEGVPEEEKIEGKIRAYKADIVVKPYKIHQGKKTIISIRIKKVYPMLEKGLVSTGERYSLKEDEEYYLVMKDYRDIHPVDAKGTVMDVKEDILCIQKNDLLETIIKPSEKALVGARTFVILVKKKSGEKTAVMYPLKPCFEIIEKPKEGFISHEVKILAEAIHKISPGEGEHKILKSKIDFAIAPNHIYKSGENSQEETILVELFNIPEEYIEKKIYIKKMTFDDYESKSHIILKRPLREGQSNLYKAKLLVDFNAKIGHPLTTLTLAVGNEGTDDYKEFDIVKKDVIELFNPMAHASDKELKRGEEMYVTINLKGMKIHRDKIYDFKFVPSAKMDIRQMKEEELGDVGIEILEANFINEKSVKLRIHVPENEMLGSYDLEVEEVGDNVQVKNEGFRTFMDRVNPLYQKKQAD